MTTRPVQLSSSASPKPNFSGQIIAELNRLREANLVRLVDALAVQKNSDGTLVALQWSDLSIEEAEDLGATVGALIGLGLGDADAVTAGAGPAGLRPARTGTSSTTPRCGTSRTPSRTAAPPCSR